jgi:hypothetical protein
MNFSDQPSTDKALADIEQIMNLKRMVVERDETIRLLRIEVGCAKTDNILIKSKLNNIITAIADAAVDLENLRDS